MAKVQLDIEKGIRSDNETILIYGASGTGKSTIACRIGFDAKVGLIKTPETVRTLVLDFENSTHLLPIDRINLYEAPFIECSETLEAVINDEEIAAKYDRIVIDSLDWYISKIERYLCEKHNKKSITDFQWGSGQQQVADIIRKQITLFDKAKNKGFGITFVAHSKKNPVDDPESGYTTDVYDIAVHQKPANIIKEYVDIVMFAHIQSGGVVQEDKGFGQTRNRQVGKEKRLLYFQPTDRHVAKSRYPLPRSCELNYLTYRDELSKAKALVGVMSNPDDV
jgi:hypothetical protein